jgi:hypothetical protein
MECITAMNRRETEYTLKGHFHMCPPCFLVQAQFYFLKQYFGFFYLSGDGKNQKLAFT